MQTLSRKLRRLIDNMKARPLPGDAKLTVNTCAQFVEFRVDSDAENRSVLVCTAMENASSDEFEWMFDTVRESAGVWLTTPHAT